MSHQLKKFLANGFKTCHQVWKPLNIQQFYSSLSTIFYAKTMKTESVENTEQKLE